MNILEKGTKITVFPFYLARKSLEGFIYLKISKYDLIFYLMSRSENLRVNTTSLFPTSFAYTQPLLRICAPGCRVKIWPNFHTKLPHL